jgi:RNA polymerase sigma-70 factor, ECF subfamily
LRLLKGREAASTASGLKSAKRSEIGEAGEAEALLLELCRRGDLRALRTLYEGEVRAVRRVARRLGLATEEEVDDVTQEVFSMAFRDIDRVRPGELSAWLYRLTSNRVTDHHRRRRVRQAFLRMLAPDDVQRSEPGPERALMRKDAETQVARILSRMNQKKRDVFVLFELEGLLGDEIAARLEIPVATVWTRLFHARRDFARLARSLQRAEPSRRAGP